MPNNHILFIISTGQIGGAQEFVKHQIEIAHNSGFKCFLVSDDERWLFENVNFLLSGFFLDNRVKKFSFLYLLRLVFFLKENRINLVVCNSAMGGVYGRLASFLLNIPSIYVSHGWSSVYNGGFFSFIFNKVEYLLSFFTTKVLCVSHNDFKIADKVIGIRKNKLVVISNSIKPKFSFNSKLNQEGIKIVTVSRLAHPKRLDLLMDAFKNFPMVHLTIIGDGIHKANLQNKIINERIENVSLIGEIPGFCEYEKFDIFALISESEGLPISAIEAMSSGLPLILSNVGGCPELINNNGVLVDNSVDSIVLGIKECMSRRDFFSLNSLSYFNSNFNLENNKFTYLELYRSLILIK